MINNSRCASSPVYKARMLAALAVANAVDHDSVISTLEYLSRELNAACTHNRIHGLLLQIYHLYGELSVFVIDIYDLSFKCILVTSDR